MQPIRLLNLGSIPAGLTQAIYHALAERMEDDAQDTIVLCRPSEPYLCLGYHQVFESIFDPEECRRRGLPVYRRRLGGGATYLDGDQLFYQCIFHHRRVPVMLKDLYAFALAAPVDTLLQLGLNAALRETNEIEVDGKRIAGTGGGRIGDAVVVVGNVLFDFDFAAMTAVWRAPGRAFRSLAGEALRESIVTLNGLGIKVSRDEVTERLIRSFAERMGRPVEPGALTAEEIEAANREVEELASAESLALHRTGAEPEPMRSLKVSARALIRFDELQNGNEQISGSFWLAGDRIQRVILESNLAIAWPAIEQQLLGSRFSDWKGQLEGVLKARIIGAYGQFPSPIEPSS